MPEHLGGFVREIAQGLTVSRDHSSADMSDDFQQELRSLGLRSLPSFVREPEGNGVAERFVRTLKENLLLVRSFATVAELVEALWEFKRLYNEQWLIAHVTATGRPRGSDVSSPDRPRWSPDGLHRAGATVCRGTGRWPFFDDPVVRTHPRIG